MNLRKYLTLPLRYKPWKPAHLRLIAADLAGASRQPTYDNRRHLAAAIDWLCRAQDERDGQTDAGGVSAGWSFEDGWLPSYPETSGYIVETFLAASTVRDRPNLVDRANRILDWLLSLQRKDGAYPGHFGEAGSEPVIFNTGQIIHGMMAGFADPGRLECLDSALRAGHWMAAQQDDDGCWRRSVHNDVPHTYNTRAAWALLRAAMVGNDAALERAARKNFDWALTQQTESGWYRTNAFTADGVPFTHNIAYCIRGLLEGGLLSGEEAYVDSATRAALAVANVQRPDGFIAGTYADNWVPRSRYCCLTGLAQMSLIWIRLRAERGEAVLIPVIDKAMNYLKCSHRPDDPDLRIRGAVAGSAPIWGRYSMFEFPNWAAKFLSDALMMQSSQPVIPAAPSAAPMPKRIVSVG